MRFRIALFSLFLAAAAAASVTVTSDAKASVSIAVQYDALVKDADSVAVITPQESTSVWEEGRIYTYTKIKIEQPVAGDATGEVWIRTMGGVVGKIGQLVDGEPVFPNGKQSLVFLRKFKTSSTYEVSARAQGQYPITIDEHTKVKKVIRSANVGVLYPPKMKAPVVDTGTTPQSNANQTNGAVAETKLRLAGEMIHDRPLDEVAKEIATNWKRLHAKQ